VLRTLLSQVEAQVTLDNEATIAAALEFSGGDTLESLVEVDVAGEGVEPAEFRAVLVFQRLRASMSGVRPVSRPTRSDILSSWHAMSAFCVPTRPSPPISEVSEP